MNIQIRRALFFLALFVAALGLVAPLLNASRFHGQIQAALERALNRRVTIGSVHFTLFSGPGFKMDNVTIEDAAEAGIEPFAHMDSLEARVRLASLWTGRLAFSSLKLVEPTINLVKPEKGPWNVQILLNRVTLPGADRQPPAAGPLSERSSRETAHTRMPELEISGGRLDFKFGDTKSVFYVNNADLDVYTNSSGELIIRFSGEPSRTDYQAQSLGRFVARGAMKPHAGAPDEFSMSVQLERTAITELNRLFGVRDLGVRGFVASNLKLDGPMAHLNISGNLRIEDIHRWDLMPNKGVGWTLDYAGLFDAPGEHVLIETRSPAGQSSPVNGRFEAFQYLSEPKWDVSFRLNDLPAAGLVETARHMGASFPPGAALDGTLNGEIRYSQPDGLTGQLVMDNASFKMTQSSPIEFASAPVELRGGELHAGPAEIKFEDNQSAKLEADYSFNARNLKLNLTTPQLSVAQTSTLVARLLGASSVPLLDRCRQGAWKGAIAYRREEDQPGEWAGSFDLQNAVFDVQGLASPVRIAASSVQINPDGIQLTRMRGRAGGVLFEGEYRLLADEDEPDAFRLSFAELKLPDLEALMTPTLTRGGGFFARALRLKRPEVPAWLAGRRIEGVVQVRNLQANGTALGSARSRLIWSGTSATLQSLELKLNRMAAAANVTIDLAGAVPAYKLTGRVTAIEYRGGAIDLDGALETSGLGQKLVTGARAEGSFSGIDITLSPDTQFDEITGDFRVEPSPTGPRLALPRVQLTQGQEVLKGQGSSQSDGRLVLELTSAARKQVRLGGMLLPVNAPAQP